MKLGFIGLGVMGRSMAGHLLNAGHDLVVFTRTKTTADALLAAGAGWAQDPASVAEQAKVVFTIVGFPADVEDVYFNPDNGLLAAAGHGQTFVDCTTSSPELAKRIATAARARGADALDAPVSGGDAGARAATLSMMVGGRRETFDSLRPLFDTIAKTVVYQGDAGAGQYTKMCNQIAIASGMIGVCEALLFALKAGLDPQTVLQSISGGAAGSWSMRHLGPRMIQGDDAPGFYVKHFVKDMRIAVQSARNLGAPYAGLALALHLYEQIEERGGGDFGTQVLYRFLLEHEAFPDTVSC